MSANTTSQERHQFWQSHIEACALQSASKAQYCRDHELSYHCFIYWHSKLAKQQPSGQNFPDNHSKLIPVSLTQSPYPAELQVQLPNGVLISGINNQSVGLIGSLIDQL